MTKTQLATVLHTWTATLVGIVLMLAGVIQQNGPGILSSLPLQDQHIGGIVISIAGSLLLIAGRGPFSSTPVAYNPYKE
jgi:hypothetical protein